MLSTELLITANQIMRKTTLRHIILFDSECWTLIKRLESQMTVADMKVMQPVCGVMGHEAK